VEIRSLEFGIVFPSAMIHLMKVSICIDVPTEIFESLEAVSSDCGFASVNEFILDVIRERVELHGLYNDLLGGAIEDADDEAVERERAWEKSVLDYDAAVKKFCIQHFFKEPRYVVNMGRYREMVDGVKGLDQAIKVGLAKYLDESKILSNIYVNVRNHFQLGASAVYENLCGSLNPNDLLPAFPDLSDLDNQFQIELADVCRRADITVAKRLQQATS
jgi:hypothetical protein